MKIKLSPTVGAVEKQAAVAFFKSEPHKQNSIPLYCISVVKETSEGET